MKRNPILLLFFLVINCGKTDYYDIIKKDCNYDKARQYFDKLIKNNDAGIFKVIDAMADCRKEEMEKFLSAEYARASETIKNHIYNKLTQNRSRIFLDTVLSILINKIQTNQDYKSELNYINSTEPSFIEKKYNEFSEKLDDARKQKNIIAIEVYLENLRALSKILNRENDETRLKSEIKSIKSEKERDELYSKFINATMNQEMVRAYNIFKRLKEKNLVQNNEKANKLEGILAEISDIEERFYETANRQDRLMIELEKAKRSGEKSRIKQLEQELQSVKSDMVLKKRSLDRAARKLGTVRELFEEVNLK
ncbi:MAG: hypothetical protein N3B13_06835 [Deltaproteobacteria bacterium]|nr:hypothetical protein [Deltaproteobacteria bacterium]